MSLFRVPIKFSRKLAFVDVFLFMGLLVFVYALVGVAHEWAGPYRPKTEIDLSILSLIRYAFFSLIRVFLGYMLSLFFTLTYGYVAAKSRLWEPVLIPLLDILQSVPVLGFMPGLVLALVSLFPTSNFGLEIAAIIMIFTGQGWNMVFSFYSSLKNVPAELQDMATMFRLKRMEILRTVELPYAATGLLWNSMLSMAGGWFFLMVIESFTLGDKDFRLPGLGSYMAVAYERHDVFAICAGTVTMFILIILVDRCLWAPLVIWSERFKFDRDSHGTQSQSIVLNLLKRSRLLALYDEWLEKVQRDLRKRTHYRLPVIVPPSSPWFRRSVTTARIGFSLLGFAFLIYGMRSMYHLVAATTATVWWLQVKGTFFTFLRVTVAVVFGTLWTVPLGVFIGTHPVWTRRLQPVVQVVASFPAPMLFPLITYLFLKIGLGIEMGSVILMLFASQWYILFNVISGATQIPHQMMEIGVLFHVRGLEYWRSIILPAIFPSLLNGWITAAGGAWNACIVSEIVQSGDRTLVASGIGASITQAAQAGDFPGLACGILTMVTTVVLLNRVLWGSLYKLAETRFRLEG